MKIKKNKDDCTELKNIQYQNMLLSNSSVSKQVIPNIENMENFLKKEKEVNKNIPWNKLGKTKKVLIINKFIIVYSKKNKLTTKQSTLLKKFLINCIERKKLQKIKDVDYNKEKEIINGIPNLSFNKKSEKYYIKKTDKKGSTTRHLAPKTKKNKKKKRNKSDSKADKKIDKKTDKKAKNKISKIIDIVENEIKTDKTVKKRKTNKKVKKNTAMETI